jgi:membrane-bound lytic murein transglycosylase D
LILLALPVAAQEPWSQEDWEDALESTLNTGLALASSPAAANLAALLTKGDQEIDWESAARWVQKGLESVSYEDLAALDPLVEEAARRLREIPEARSYLAWLEQRLDYYQAADTAVRASRAQVKPPLPPRPRRLTLDPGDAQMWRARMAQRPRPKSADELVPRLKSVFVRNGVPPEWVWIAEVESGMNPDARSPAGALGLFQLMPDTAKHLGLRTWPRDERRNPERNADAAARYLKRLRERFGDWALTLAAYNAGEGRVAQLLKERKAKTFDAIASRLPAETRMYVPRVLATVAQREGSVPGI